MPRKGIEIERSSYIRMDRWEKPTLAELVLPHALDTVRGSALLHHRTFYADFALPLTVPVFCLAFAVPIDGRDYALK